jgi:hypothetical protein
MRYTDNITVPEESLGPLCRKYHIRRLSIFGSAMGGDFKPDSDIDLLVEFDPAFIPGLSFFSIQEELSSLFGHKVDLNTPDFLSRYFRDDVLQQAEAIYEQ